MIKHKKINQLFNHLWLLVIIMATGCDPQGQNKFFSSAKDTGQKQDNTPVISQVIPARFHLDEIARLDGSPADTTELNLKIQGKEFYPSTRVLFGGLEKEVTYVSPMELQVSISVDDIQNPLLQFQPETFPGSFASNRRIDVSVSSIHGSPADGYPVTVEGFINMGRPVYVCDFNSIYDSFFQLLDFSVSQSQKYYILYEQNNDVDQNGHIKAELYLVRSTDEGLTWELPKKLPLKRWVTHEGIGPYLVVDKEENIYVVIAEERDSASMNLILFKSSDGGKTWIKKTVNRSDVRYGKYSVVIDKNQYIFIVVEIVDKISFFVSRDRGKSWQRTIDIEKDSSSSYIGFNVSLGQDGLHILYQNNYGGYTEFGLGRIKGPYTAAISQDGKSFLIPPLELNVQGQYDVFSLFEPGLIIDKQNNDHFFCLTEIPNSGPITFDELLYFSFRAGGKKVNGEKIVAKMVRDANNVGICEDGTIWVVIKSYDAYQHRWCWFMVYSQDGGKNFHKSPIPGLFSDKISPVVMGEKGRFGVVYIDKKNGQDGLFYLQNKPAE